MTTSKAKPMVVLISAVAAVNSVKGKCVRNLGKTTPNQFSTNTKPNQTKINVPQT